MKRAEHQLKGLAFGLARRFLRPPPATAGSARERLEHRSQPRVLVVRQDRRLGNLVMTTSLMQGLRRCFPDAWLEVLAPAGFAAILDGHPAVDRVIPVTHRALITRPWKIAALSQKLRKPRPVELVIDASPVHHFSLSSGLACWASGAPLRLGYDRGEARSFLNLLTPPPPPGEPEHRNIHGVLAGLVAAPAPAPLPSLGPSTVERERAAAAIRRWGWEGQPVVGLHPGTRPEKRWAVERFEAAARRIEAGGGRVLIFSGPGEQVLLEAMGPPGPTRVYAPPTHVRGLMALLETCSVFLSGDCGPMHLAAALGVRCVSIFRIDNFDRYGPPGAGHRVLYAPDGSVEAEVVAQQVLELIDVI